MKKKLVLCSMFFTISVSFFLEPTIGCLDDKHHINEYGGKRYQPVNCNCPCGRYKHSLDRNRCTVCLHYRDPEKTAY